MPPRASLTALVLVLHACNSDDLGGLDLPDTTDATTTTGSSTGAPPTTGELTTTSATTTTTTGATTTGATTEAPPEPPTCGELLDCVLPCALMFDLECAQMCADGLAPEEGTKAFELAVCVGMACFDSGACSADSLMDPICLACIGFLLMDDQPKGCEAEADACG